MGSSPIERRSANNPLRAASFRPWITNTLRGSAPLTSVIDKSRPSQWALQWSDHNETLRHSVDNACARALRARPRRGRLDRQSHPVKVGASRRQQPATTRSLHRRGRTSTVGWAKAQAISRTFPRPSHRMSGARLSAACRPPHLRWRRSRRCGSRRLRLCNSACQTRVVRWGRGLGSGPARCDRRRAGGAHGVPPAACCLRYSRTLERVRQLGQPVPSSSAENGSLLARTVRTCFGRRNLGPGRGSSSS